MHNLVPMIWGGFFLEFWYGRSFLFVPGWMTTCTWEAWVWGLRLCPFYDEDGYDWGPLLEGGPSEPGARIFLFCSPERHVVAACT
ncbi:hypothetical protein B0T18DRAFT_419491 [Schizothecium vesticola]|uniref:Uncharacterized protein n=1 Tax=Schizothecium vesticola TaxID=314040 RepID=A0AA40K047_9PEZI|nr:hypothetical protein B0T18DRAFT_419491 [Schizothecium vesticola]